jgi:glycosyltransferase involved in cell wall biosynthesis
MQSRVDACVQWSCCLLAAAGVDMPLSPPLARAHAAGERLWVASRSIVWQPYSRLFLVGDGAAWALSEDMRALQRLARELGVRVASLRRPLLVKRQAVFHASHFALLEPSTFDGQHRIALAYFHGRPSTQQPVFTECFSQLRRRHKDVCRVQVSHTAMRDLILESGIAPDKVFLIPIGITIGAFPLASPDSRTRARQALGIPSSATVVGSFQKDGVGWVEGLEPKLVKGPDVFLDVIARLREQASDLFVLLSGPARGYVKAGLERLGVPYRHVYVAQYREMSALYHALDVYLVTSREEGGPKAVLESMASGVPLVSTRVGQATDLIRHGWNGWLAESGDVDALAAAAIEALERRSRLSDLIARARQTAAQHTYDAQLPLWRRFFQGFVEPAT